MKKSLKIEWFDFESEARDAVLFEKVDVALYQKEEIEFKDDDEDIDAFPLSCPSEYLIFCRQELAEDVKIALRAAESRERENGIATIYTNDFPDPDLFL